MALSFSIHTRDEPCMDFIKLLLEEYNFGVIDSIHQDTMEHRFDVHYLSINEKGHCLKNKLHTKLHLMYGSCPTGVLMYSITPL
jgi:hypothetical protein